MSVVGRGVVVWLGSVVVGWSRGVVEESDGLCGGGAGWRMCLWWACAMGADVAMCVLVLGGRVWMVVGVCVLGVWA